MEKRFATQADHIARRQFCVITLYVSETSCSIGGYSDIYTKESKSNITSRFNGRAIMFPDIGDVAEVALGEPNIKAETVDDCLVEYVDYAENLNALISKAKEDAKEIKARLIENLVNKAARISQRRIVVDECVKKAAIAA